MRKVITLLLLLFTLLQAKNYQEITFPSLDGLKISAFLYSDQNRSKPFILLFHQANYSKGEYLEIAPKLTAMGFNVMTVDLRNGDNINGIMNETSDRAFEKDLDISYLATIPDIKASITYAREKLASGKLLLWGSSYSASLVLVVADQSSEVDAVLSFSPGEYLRKREKGFVRKHVKHLKIPVFITSAKDEKENWEPIYQAIPSKQKYYFIPKSEGKHGSKALWENNPDHQEYWDAVKQFLKNFVE